MVTLEPQPGPCAYPTRKLSSIARTCGWWTPDKDANTAKSNSWRMSDGLAQPVVLRGSLIPFAREFKQLGVGVVSLSPLLRDPREGRVYVATFDFIPIVGGHPRGHGLCSHF